MSKCLNEFRGAEISAGNQNGRGPNAAPFAKSGRPKQDVSIEGPPVDAVIVMIPFHIVLVDDNEQNRAVMEQIRRREGHAVTAAGNGREAIEHLATKT